MADTVMEEAESTNVDSADPDSEATCHFLRIPKEIRLEIYRSLILPKPVIDICPAPSPPSRLPKLLDSEIGSDEDEWTDELTDEEDNDDSDTDSVMSEFMQDIEGELFSDDEDYSSFDSEDDEDAEGENTQRHLAILRTSRQIHDEAQSLFYTEAILTLDPGDIFSLAKKPQNLRFGYPNPPAWKHNPLFGIGKKDKTGVITYKTAELLGSIEPHVFARFQKISFDAFFDDEHTQYLEMWIDDDTHVFKPEDAALFKKMLRQSLLFKHLFKILSNSERITLLEIRLEVEVMANSNILEADMEDETDEEDEMYLERQLKVEKIEEIANQKATELFLDSKIMDPLLKLSNVSRCDFKFGFEHLEEEDAYKPPKKYVEILRDMKERIESNFKRESEGSGPA